MTTTCSSIVGEAINALLRGHDKITDQAESEGQYQRLKRRSDAFESQLEILKSAKKHVDEACDPKPLERSWDTLLSGPSTEVPILDINGAWVREYWRTEIGKSFPASKRNPALDDHILEWSQKTIESVTRKLIEEQLDDGAEGDAWSLPVVVGPVIVRDHVQRHISLLEKRLANAQNNLLPIARLPPEILIGIFALVLDEGQSYLRDDTNTLLSILSRICRDWAGLVDSTPLLWSCISPYRSTTKHVTMALIKSKPSPLTLHFNEEKMVHIRPDRFFDAIKRHGSRWKVLELRLCSKDTLQTMNSRFANVVPRRLEGLKVTLTVKVTTAPLEIDFIKGPWPDTLRHLSLHDIGIPSRSYAELRGLRTLWIWSHASRGVVKIEEIIRVLSDCPELENLALGDGIVLRGQPISRTPGLGLPVRLEHLREISLNFPPAPLHALLSNLQAQNCTKFRIQTNRPFLGGTWTQVLLTKEIRPFIRTMESALLSVSTVDIAVNEYSATLKTNPQNGKFKVYLQFGAGRTAEVGKWMADCLSLVQAPVTLDIVPRHPMWMETLPLMLSRFHTIVMLNLHGNHRVCQHVLDFMGTALHTDPAGFPCFPIPRLTSLVIEADCLPSVISMIERRYGRHGSTGITDATRLVGLSKLTLVGGSRMGGPGSTFAQQLVSALPSCEIEWK